MPSRTVLVIDDEDAVRAAVRLTLEDDGYTVLDASNGRIGLDLLRAATEPLVVLLDLMMPGMSGLQFLRALSMEPAVAAPHAIVIFTAARAFPAPTLVSYLPRKTLLDLPKPFNIDQLVTIVDEAKHQIESEYAAQ